MTAPVVLAERPAEGVGLIRINRPDVRNALNLEVRKLLAKHLTEMSEDAAIANQLLFSSQDQKEGMAAFIEKRKARFTGR